MVWSWSWALAACLPTTGVRVGSQQKIKIFGFLPPLPALRLAAFTIRVGVAPPVVLHDNGNNIKVNTFH